MPWYSSRPYYPKTSPRRAAEGVQAKSRKGEIGETWWSRRFVTVLESFTDRSRLQRGRSYARSGQVIGLDVTAGAATARVQGSRPRPYEVRIEVTPLAKKDWTAIEDALASRALFAARLLAGDMPHEIEEVFAGVGRSLFPASAREVKTSCSCPDWANPCKHVAATYYILAERFDEDPFLMFAWRGRTRDDLIERLRALRGAADPEPAAPARVDPPLAERIHDFWRAGEDALALRFQPDADARPDALARRLGPVVGDTRDLARHLAPAWGRIAEHARKRAFEE